MENLSVNDKCLIKGISWAILGFCMTFAFIFIGWAAFGLVIINFADFETVEQVVLFNNIMNEALLIVLLNALYLATSISIGLLCLGFLKEWTVIKLFSEPDA